MSSFDLETYIRQYSGRMKIERLVHISEVSPTLAVDAAKLAISELKKGRNTTLYRELSAKFQQKGLPIVPDEEWAVRVDEESRKQLEKLEMELSQSKTNLIKESIRLGYNELGAFYYDRGDLPSALNSYVRTRDYCTTPKQLLEMCLNVVRVAIELRKFNQIMPYVEKGRQHVDATKDKRDSGKLKVANGLVLLDGQKYRHAARFFVETPTELGDGFSEIIAANDVAIYGALCALATFDRSEIKQKLIDNPDFKNYLELVPEIREIIQDFYDSRYTTCLSALERMRDSLVLDLFLHHHVEALYQQIRQRALRQYVSPFMSVDLNRMAKAFNTTTPLLEKELAQLIMMENGIQARIDSHNKVLYARRDNQRVVTFEKVLQTGKDFVSETEANVRRLNMMKHDFHVRAPKVDIPSHLLSATPMNLSAR